MEENQNPPILVTSDVKFAVMKDGTVVTDKEVDEGPGWLDVAQAFVDRIQKAGDTEFLGILMAVTLVVRPALQAECKKREQEIKAKKAAENE